MAKRGLDPNAIQRIREDLNRGLADSRPTPPDDAEEFVRPSYIASGHDVGPYAVGKATQYYQGPQLSTRVAAHSFVPLDENGEPWLNREQEEFLKNRPSYQMGQNVYGKTRKTPMSDQEHGPYGYVFVKWHKPKKNGSIITVYGTIQLVPLSVYRTFRDYYSKGRAVVHMLEHYGYGDGDSSPYKNMSGITDI